MSRLFDTFRTSIGKKLMMAVTGLGFCVFLLIHLLGNLTVYAGRQSFESYVEHLHALGPLVTVAELGLLLFLVIHVSTGAVLYFQNLKARPSRYVMKKRAGGRTIGSATAPYTGILILLFLVIHLATFHFVEHPQGLVFNTLAATFQSLAYVLFYVAAVVIVAVHVRHGFWSLFQTLGANHTRYMPVIQGAGILFALFIGIGFGSIPIYVALL